LLYAKIITLTLSELGYPTTLENLNRRFLKFLSNPGYGVAVYEKDNKMLGLVAWAKSTLFVSDKTRFHIEGLIVLKSHRGIVIGRKLVEFVEKIAMQYYPVIVDLTSATVRAQDGTHEFYKHLDYKNNGPMGLQIYLRKEL
jgi:ribosomal protein S18 acetylase RimI-like enzyme